MNGVDVSGWQPANITRTIPADFAIVKATEGVDFTNTSWVSQITGAIETASFMGCTIMRMVEIRLRKPTIS